jgi:hypothetical protein
MWRDLFWFMVNSLYSAADLLEILERVGLIGKAWDDIVVDNDMQVLLSDKEYGRALEKYFLSEGI